MQSKQVVINKSLFGGFDRRSSEGIKKERNEEKKMHEI